MTTQNTIQFREQAFIATNVNVFQGWDVVNGEVSLTDEQYVEILNDLYGDVDVCGMSYGSGSVLVDQDPTAFRCMKGDYEDYIQTDLEDQLDREDESNIEFEIDPDDLPSEDDVEDDE